jgi:hypothetical protein
VRAVEPGRLYRASSFPVNAQLVTPDGARPHAAALVGGEWFEFLRARNIRQVVTLDPADPAAWAEEGYYKYWRERTKYPITLRRIPVVAADAYARNERSGLHAGAELIGLMKGWRPEDGAVLVHGDTGKDGVGIAVATYEAWRNRGSVEPGTLWSAITARYLLSNQLLAETGPFAGTPARCPSGAEGYVCPEWLGALRKDVEFVARL